SSRVSAHHHTLRKSSSKRWGSRFYPVPSSGFPSPQVASLLAKWHRGGPRLRCWSLTPQSIWVSSSRG
ncbi:hypothetical protein FRB98_005033, partial [Tulasnella sp. 332]